MMLGQLHRQAQSLLQSQRAEGHLGVDLDDRASSHGKLAHAWLRAYDPAFERRLYDALQRCKLNRYKISTDTSKCFTGAYELKNIKRERQLQCNCTMKAADVL